MEGICDIKKFEFVEDDFINKNNIKWIKGVEVIKVDIRIKKVIVFNGEEIEFDKLFIVIGFNIFFLFILNLKEVLNVIGFCNFDDCEKIMEMLKICDNIVVMGVGFVGIDVILGLIYIGKNVVFVEMKDYMFLI